MSEIDKNTTIYSTNSKKISKQITKFSNIEESINTSNSSENSSESDSSIMTIKKSKNMNTLKSEFFYFVLIKLVIYTNKYFYLCF